MSYVDSEVRRSDFELAQKSAGGLEVSPTRALQGQSEIVGNLDLSYEHFSRGASISLAYNYTGERLYSISLGSLPDVFEAPSGQLDLIWSQRFGDKLSMKFALKNLLDDSSKKFLRYDGEESVYSEYSKGLTTSLSFTYRFY